MDDRCEWPARRRPSSSQRPHGVRTPDRAFGPGSGRCPKADPRCGPRTPYIRHEKLPVYKESPWLTTQTAGFPGKSANFRDIRRTAVEIGELPWKSANFRGNRRTAVEIDGLPRKSANFPGNRRTSAGIGELPWKSANFRGNRRTSAEIGGLPRKSANCREHSPDCTGNRRTAANIRRPAGREHLPACQESRDAASLEPVCLLPSAFCPLPVKQKQERCTVPRLAARRSPSTARQRHKYSSTLATCCHSVAPLPMATRMP